MVWCGMKTIISLCINFFLVLLLNACAYNTETIYKEVKIPVKCNIRRMERPTYKGELMIDLQNLLIYSDLIENNLNFCLGE